jgi:3-oxoacyl-[acyl-carrier-protein] synthase-3
MGSLRRNKYNRIGIEAIASYIPENKISNYSRKLQFSIDDHFIDQKIGIRSIALKDDKDEASDLCVKAFKNLSGKIDLNKSDIDVLIVITQNPDTNIPHTSAIVHDKLKLHERCACFDVSLGCSGFVYGLSIIQSFMKENHFQKGLLFTSDPYSKIIDKDDKNTSLLFGDASSATLISDKPLYTLEGITFGTLGKGCRDLTCVNNKLSMNGREVFNFVMTYIPDDIRMLLERKKIQLEDIDTFVFHQASRHLVDTLSARLHLDKKKVVFDIYEYGNTVSSSIPIILEKELTKAENNFILVSGFGVGFSWASGILKRL